MSVLLTRSLDEKRYDDRTYRKRSQRNIKFFMLMLSFDFLPPFIPHFITDWMIKLVVEMILAFLDIYLLICIHSLYTKIKEDPQPPEEVPLQKTATKTTEAL